MKKLLTFIVFLFVIAPQPVIAGKISGLPEPNTTGSVFLEQTLEKRRSIRSFKTDKLSIDQISQLLWAAQGITAPMSGFRTAPSAGATYPLELYVVTGDWVGLYQPRGHKLNILSNKDQRTKLAAASFGQMFISKAPLSIVIASVPARTEGRYGKKAKRYINMEVGHAAQNIHLQAVALGLGSVPVGAFSELAVKKILNLPENQIPLYIIPVGYPSF